MLAMQQSFQLRVISLFVLFASGSFLGEVVVADPNEIVNISPETTPVDPDGHIAFDMTENGKEKMFVNNNEDLIFDVSIVNSTITAVGVGVLQFNASNMKIIDVKEDGESLTRNSEELFEMTYKNSPFVLKFNCSLPSFLPPLTEVEIKINMTVRAKNSGTITYTSNTVLPLYVLPPVIKTNVSAQKVELINETTAIKININGLEGDFPLTLEIICGLNETKNMKLHLVDEDNKISAGFTQTALTIPYSEDNKTDESFTLLLNRTVMNNTENITDVIAFGILIGDNGAVVEHIEVTIPEVEPKENERQGDFDWLKIIERRDQTGNLIDNRRQTILYVGIYLPDDDHSVDDDFTLESSSNMSIGTLSEEFSITVTGKELEIEVKISDSNIPPLQKIPIDFKLHKGGEQIYQTITSCFYGGVPEIFLVPLYSPGKKEFTPEMKFSMIIKIDPSNVIKVDIPMKIQVKLPSSNRMPYLRLTSQSIATKDTSILEGHTIDRIDTFGDGNEDVVNLNFDNTIGRNSTTIRINVEVLNNSLLNETATKFPVSIAVIVGTYMAYFDQHIVYLKKEVTYTTNKTNITDTTSNTNITDTKNNTNITESKDPKVNVGLEATLQFNDEVSIDIRIDHESQNSAPVNNMKVMIYKLPFVLFKDALVDSKLKYTEEIKYAQLWKFQGTFTPGERISITQRGHINDKFLLAQKLNELYVLVQVSFKKLSGEVVHLDRLAQLSVYKRPTLIVPLHPKRLQEYYGLGLFFDERGNGLNLIACMNQHKTSSEVACFQSSNYGATWKEMDIQIGCIIGYNHEKTGLVGISRNQQYYIHYRDESRCYVPYEGEKTHFGKPIVLEDAEYVKMQKTANVKGQHKKTYKNHEFAGTVHGLYYKDKNANDDWALRMKW